MVAPVQAVSSAELTPRRPAGMPRILGLIANVLHRVGGLLFLPALVLTVGYDIFMRYVLVTPSEWANEMSSVLLAAVFFLSLAEVTLRGNHLATDILYTRFNPRMRFVADALAAMLGLLFLGMLIWLLVMLSRLADLCGRRRRDRSFDAF